jgi:hypothetical protein
MKKLLLFLLLAFVVSGCSYPIGPAQSPGTFDISKISPSNFRVVSETDHSVMFSWSPMPTATGYNLFYRHNTNGKYDVVGLPNYGNVNYTFDNLTFGSTLEAYVVAVNQQGVISQPSQTIQVSVGQ